MTKIESNMNLCHKCSREINVGESYYCITRNLEHFVESEDNLEFEVEVEESEEVMSLCIGCGSVFNQSALIKILELLPIPGGELKN